VTRVSFRAAGGASLCGNDVDREQEMLGGHVVVLQLAHLLLGVVEHQRQALDEIQQRLNTLQRGGERG